jgi:nitrite reductase (NADH) small subunit
MGEWVDAESMATLERRRKLVVDVAGRDVALFYVDGQVRALDNTCTHKQRELVKGTILGDRIVCPGHQWAFNLETGYEAKKCRYQPVFETRVEDGRIIVSSEPSSIPEDESAEALDGPAA